jgi:hypothetical protein
MTPLFYCVTLAQESRSSTLSQTTCIVSILVPYTLLMHFLVGRKVKMMGVHLVNWFAIIVSSMRAVVTSQDIWFD